MQAVVLGGGYAGVALTRRLEDRLPSDVEILLIDDTGEHLVQHELHRVIRRPSLADEITIPLSDVVYRARTEQATVESIDVEEQRVKLTNADPIEYDIGAICLGAETASHDIPGVSEHGVPLKRLPDATEIRERFLDLLEAGDGRVVVGGAGLSGVQVAGELAALARERCPDPDNRPEILLLEQFDAIAPGFDERFGRALADALREQEIRIRTNATVVRAEEDAVELAGGDRLDCDVLVWTGGIVGPAALEGARLEVQNTLQLDDRTFVLGDAARVIDANGQLVPASAQSAIREAKAAAESITRLVEYDLDGGELFEPRLQRFTFDSPGWVVSVGDDAVAQIGPTVLTGRAAVAAKATVGAGYLTTVGAIRNAVDLVNAELGHTVD